MIYIKKALLFAALLAVLLIFAGCIPGDGEAGMENPAGFFWGIWHGGIYVISFFMGLFTDNKYTIYETFNNGWRYNLGYLIGSGVFFGGGFFSIHKTKHRGE